MSQTTLERPSRPKSEFLGLHDPYAAPPKGAAPVPRPPRPLINGETRGELLRAGATLSVLFLVIAVAISAVR